jgi:hypothetical protein
MLRKVRRHGVPGWDVRGLCLVLTVLFLTGYLPSRVAPCGCTAERNCGCSCASTRTARSPLAKGDCCAARPAAATPGSAVRRACAVSSAPLRSRDPEGAPSSRHETAGPLDWVLTDAVGVPSRPETARVAAVPAPAASNRSHAPPTPPPESGL